MTYINRATSHLRHHMIARKVSRARQKKGSDEETRTLASRQAVSGKEARGTSACGEISIELYRGPSLPCY